MKKVILFVFLTAMGCQSEKIEAEQEKLNVRAGLREDFSLKINQQAQIDGFKLSFDSFSDSRCPINAYCIRAGEATVDLAVNDTQKIQMCLGDCHQVHPTKYKSFVNQDSLEVLIQNKSYLFILKQVLPYPGTSGEADVQKKYEVKMEIVKN